MNSQRATRQRARRAGAVLGGGAIHAKGKEDEEGAVEELGVELLPVALEPVHRGRGRGDITGLWS